MKQQLNIDDVNSFHGGRCREAIIAPTCAVLCHVKIVQSYPITFSEVLGASLVVNFPLTWRCIWLVFCFSFLVSRFLFLVSRKRTSLVRSAPSTLSYPYISMDEIW